MPHKVDPTLRPFHAQIYAAIREAWLEHGIAPSQIELRNAVGCSITTVIQGLTELRKRGYITAEKFAARSVQPTDFNLTISTEPPDPWASLDEVRFFKPPAWEKTRE